MNRLTPDWNAYMQCLRELLLATSDSKSDAKVVYQLLERNLDKLDDNFDEILCSWSTSILAQAEPETAVSIARIIGNFSILIQQFPLGNKAINIEIAITGHLIALKVYKDTNFLQDLANTQNNLGLAYSNRIRGDKTENLEMAIAAFYDALIVRIRSDFPQDWAITQLNLGGTYIERIKGNKADNLEQAITALSNADYIFNRSKFPQEWAMIQHNIGTAYQTRIKGDKADNLEQAITALSNALEVRNRNDFPQAWAETKNNLGITFRHRIKGDKADNLEQAIKDLSNALEVRNRNDFPQAWAETQNNLGNAYIDRIKGDKVQNLEQAITAFSNALQVFTRNNFPQAWADVQSNLGNAYRARIKGDKAQNLEQAIILYNTALEVRTCSDFPQAWAETQNNLGNAYTERIEGVKANNLEKAITAFTNALEVRTCSDFPQAWAETQNNLGIAYANSYYIREESKDDNLKNAITSYSNALNVRTSTNFPEKYAETSLNLGGLYYESFQYELAESTFYSAIETIENLRDEIVSGDESKLKQSEKWNILFRTMVEVCLALGKDTAAIEYVERSKTRNLVELILERDSKTIFPLEVFTQLEQLRDEIASKQYQLQNGKADNPKVLAQHLQELRQQRNNLQDQYLPVGSSFKFNQFQKTLNANTAIIEWYIASDRILSFIIKPHGQQLTSWQSQAAELDALINWSNEYLNDYYNPEDKNKIQWQNQLETRLNKLAEILHIQEILAQIPEQCQRLILIPHRFLHLFPFHALPVKSSYLIDLFPKGVSYAPSCQILQQVQLRQHPESQSLLKSLFAVQNPTADLYEIYEKDLGAVAVIKKKFTQAHVIKQAKANKSAILHVDENHHTTLNQELRQASSIFFFCHGYFSRNSPQDSGLQLADENLTLTEIIAYFKLANCHLVTLSACETGMIDFRETSTSDEYIGLPSGFLLAGSTNVVSSLWTVDATATALFMIKFYEELQQQTNIVLALNAAQRWLRNTTTKGFQDWLPKSSLSISWQKVIDKYFTEIAKDKGESTPPFESPFYWAAFYHTGKGV